jgi:hypothetical protein
MDLVTSIKEIQEKRELIAHLRNDIDDIVKKHFPEYHEFFHRLGTWDCKDSPIFICIYDMDDTAQNNCIFCGEPHERK